MLNSKVNIRNIHRVAIIVSTLKGMNEVKSPILLLPDHTESIKTSGLDGRLFREYFERMKYMCKTYTPLRYEI